MKVSIEADPSLKKASRLFNNIEETAALIPERGEKFALSVLDTANDIMDSIEERSFATDEQIEAMENMLNGLERWL